MMYGESEIQPIDDSPSDKKNPFLQRRLDYIFISNELQESIVNVEVLPSVNGDHFPIYLKLAENTSPSRGWSYWKLTTLF